MQCRLILRMKLPYMAKVWVFWGGMAVRVLLTVEWWLLSSVRNVVDCGECVYACVR